MVNQQKIETVKKFTQLMKEYPVIGIVDITSLPAPQYQNIRAQLRENVLIKLTKKRLIKKAIEEASKEKTGLENLKENVTGMPAVLFTKINPFSLFKILKKNKSSAPAKEGQIAPNDIIIPAGPTPFAPGPIIGELGSLGIKTGVENGKVVIKENSLVIKEGEKISKAITGVLTRLNIKPMEIGLNLTAVYENGNIFKKSILDIDEEEYINNITTGARWAFNLAMEAGILTTETTTALIQKAVKEAKNLAMEANILTKDTVGHTLSKAQAQANALQNQIGGK